MIFTLEARDNILLEFLADGANPNFINIEVKYMFEELKKILASKNIDYHSLKSALVPNINRKEILLIFDRDRIKASWYGNEVFEKIIPIFNKKTNHSVFSGDYLIRWDITNDKQLYDMFIDEVMGVKEYEYRYCNQFYMVYINNLSEFMFREFIEKLSPFWPFIGYADLTFASPLKSYISHILLPNFLKTGNKVIMAHEFDLGNSEDYNIKGYPFEKNGYEYFSLQSHFYETFLSYKIERPQLKGKEHDNEISLMSLFPELVGLEQLEVLIDETKIGYLRLKKMGSFQRANIEISKENIEEAIRSRINNSYIFNLSPCEATKTIKFDTILEFDNRITEIPSKMLVALEYIPIQKKIRVITMY